MYFKHTWPADLKLKIEIALYRRNSIMMMNVEYYMYV